CISEPDPHIGQTSLIKRSALASVTGETPLARTMESSGPATPQLLLGSLLDGQLESNHSFRLHRTGFSAVSESLRRPVRGSSRPRPGLEPPDVLPRRLSRAGVSAIEPPRRAVV